MKLLVAIPTWNRADYLDTAIRAIAAARAMARTCTVELFVSDNCSSDHTQEVIARWQKDAPWIHARHWEEHISDSWPGILKRAFQGHSLDYDYLWLQGDDDYITDPTAYQQLSAALDACAEDLPAIVHCCQTKRALPNDKRIIVGNTEDLCNTYGWHDLLGWISGLVISRETVDRMWTSPHCDTKHSAFWHSELLLEVAYGRTMLVLASGLIDCQDAEQTPATIERWSLGEGANKAYWRIIPGLMSLKQRGVLTTPISLRFFRYLTYSFWDRFAAELIQQACSPQTTDEFLEAKAFLLKSITHLLGHGEERKLYESWLHDFLQDVGRVRHTLQMVKDRVERAEQAAYPLQLLSLPDRSG